jgi:tetratricopeptide (TPR) repeat protein
LKQARVEEAIPHFRAAAALDPTDPNSNLNIGTYEQMHGNFPAAIELYKKAATISRNPRTTGKAYNNLGYAYKDIHDLPHARESFQEAVKADPEFVGAWLSLGLTAQHMGDLQGAIQAYSQAAAMNPTDLNYLLLAQAQEQAGDSQKAKATRHQAELLSRNIISAQHSADQLLAK